jgi:hypothetical protein
MEYGWIILWHMEFTSNPFEIKTVESTSFDTTTIYPLIIPYTTRKETSFYFLTIIKFVREINNYDRIILFGPTNAKSNSSMY